MYVTVTRKSVSIYSAHASFFSMMADATDNTVDPEELMYERVVHYMEKGCYPESSKDSKLSSNLFNLTVPLRLSLDLFLMQSWTSTGMRFAVSGLCRITSNQTTQFKLKMITHDEGRDLADVSLDAWHPNVIIRCTKMNTRPILGPIRSLW